MSEPYDEKIMEDCPDCGGFLVGSVCHSCQVYWKFRNVPNSEEENGNN